MIDIQRSVHPQVSTESVQLWAGETRPGPPNTSVRRYPVWGWDWNGILHMETKHARVLLGSYLMPLEIEI